MKEYHKYSYDGPVFVFDICVTEHWQGETVAPSEGKARSNLVYQYKKNNGLCSGAKVILTDKLELVN